MKFLLLQRIVIGAILIGIAIVGIIVLVAETPDPENNGDDAGKESWEIHKYWGSQL